MEFGPKKVSLFGHIGNKVAKAFRDKVELRKEELEELNLKKRLAVRTRLRQEAHAAAVPVVAFPNVDEPQVHSAANASGNSVSTEDTVPLTASAASSQFKSPPESVVLKSPSSSRGTDSAVSLIVPGREPSIIPEEPERSSVYSLGNPLALSLSPLSLSYLFLSLFNCILDCFSLLLSLFLSLTVFLVVVFGHGCFFFLFLSVY